MSEDGLVLKSTLVTNGISEIKLMSCSDSGNCEVRCSPQFPYFLYFYKTLGNSVVASSTLAFRSKCGF